MADKSDEEHLDNPTNNQSENPSDETTSTKDAETITQTQDTENMEVHHHAHHEGKKNWRSYFWEFLMLFLAVFCGFLAEYQLEHVVEHNREKQYIQSMVDDLRKDSIRFKRIVDFSNQQVSGFDSLLHNIYHTPYTDSSTRTLYYLKEKHALVIYRMYFEKGTISQLKNAGGLRLIRKRGVADSILSYEIHSERIEKQGEGLDFSLLKLLDVSVKIFDGELVFGLDQRNLILTSNKKFELLSNEGKLIKEYANLAKFKRDVTLNYIKQMTNLQNRIPAIIQFLEKEYHLN
jgi:hypothetical protein